MLMMIVMATMMKEIEQPKIKEVVCGQSGHFRTEAGGESNRALVDFMKEKNKLNTKNGGGLFVQLLVVWRSIDRTESIDPPKMLMMLNAAAS